MAATDPPALFDLVPECYPTGEATLFCELCAQSVPTQLWTGHCTFPKHIGKRTDLAKNLPLEFSIAAYDRATDSLLALAGPETDHSTPELASQPSLARRIDSGTMPSGPGVRYEFRCACCADAAQPNSNEHVDLQREQQRGNLAWAIGHYESPAHRSVSYPFKAKQKKLAARAARASKTTGAKIKSSPDVARVIAVDDGDMAPALGSKRPISPSQAADDSAGTKQPRLGGAQAVEHAALAPETEAKFDEKRRASAEQAAHNAQRLAAAASAAAAAPASNAAGSKSAKGKKKPREIISESELNMKTKLARSTEDDRKRRVAAAEKAFVEGTATNTTESVLRIGELPVGYACDEIARVLMPHQVEGLRFLWSHLAADAGYGCLLAHDMGLGKTLQTVSFIEAFLRHRIGETVLVLSPVTVQENWGREFKKWVPQRVRPRIKVLDASSKTADDRLAVLESWHRKKGVLLIGYTLFRKLCTDARAARYLLDPGPDCVVADEGHVIRNQKSAVSVALKSIKTPRRLCLTGYPLQNRLEEYWCMVDWVRPHFLGTQSEFRNMFVSPIMAGQCIDSTDDDVLTAKGRSFVLFELLESIVHRRTVALIRHRLPAFHEFSIKCKMSAIQKSVYESFLVWRRDHGAESDDAAGCLEAEALLSLLLGHPFTLLTEVRRRFLEAGRVMPGSQALADAEAAPGGRGGGGGGGGGGGRAGGGGGGGGGDDDDDDDDGLGGAEAAAIARLPKPLVADMAEEDEMLAPRDKFGTSHAVGAAAVSLTSYDNDDVQLIRRQPVAGRGKGGNAAASGEREEPALHFEQWGSAILNERLDQLKAADNSGKLLVMLYIVHAAKKAGDRVVIFSKRVPTLRFISSTLDDYKFSHFTLTGETPAHKRQAMIDAFNKGKNDVFLMSTVAGSLGINLIGANRVVLFDICWNPCHDDEAVVRPYRFGQRKEVFVYRLLSHGSVEHFLHKRQEFKKKLAANLVDTRAVAREAHSHELKTLFSLETFRKESETSWTLSDEQARDTVFCALAANCASTVTSVEPVQLRDDELERLTEAEKGEARMRYYAEAERAQVAALGGALFNPVLAGLGFGGEPGIHLPLVPDAYGAPPPGALGAPPPGTYGAPRRLPSQYAQSLSAFDMGHFGRVQTSMTLAHAALAGALPAHSALGLASAGLASAAPDPAAAMASRAVLSAEPRTGAVVLAEHVGKITPKARVPFAQRPLQAQVQSQVQSPVPSQALDQPLSQPESASAPMQL